MTRTPSRASARPRRSQAERSATTRRKIIDAVAVVIAEEGFAQASSHRIAKRAGVTWGAVQYHFGAKADILGAVMDDGLERFARRTRDLSLDGRPLAQRVSLLVDRCWEFYSSLHYRAMLEIVLNARSAEASERVHDTWRSDSAGSGHCVRMPMSNMASRCGKAVAVAPMRLAAPP